MIKKILKSGIMAAVLVFGMVWTGCTNPAANIDSWSPVTDFSQLIGTWDGSYNLLPISFEQFYTSLTGEDYSNDLQAEYGNIIVNRSMIFSISFSINADTQDKMEAINESATTVFSGGNIEADNVWQDICDLMINNHHPNAVPNPSNYSFTEPMDLPAQPLTDENIAELLDGTYQINQAGNMIKISGGVIMADTDEVYMTLQ